MVKSTPNASSFFAGNPDSKQGLADRAFGPACESEGPPTNLASPS